jgi:hypothetical protein
MKYRAVRYYGTPQQQQTRFQGQLIGCTETSFATGLDDVTFGAIIVDERTCRKLSGETPPDPASPGLNQGQLVKIANQLHVDYTSHVGATRAIVKTLLDNNQRVVAQLWYAGVGGGNIGHAWLLERRKFRQGSWQLKVVDPMPGERFWIAEHRVYEAMESFAERSGLEPVGLYFGAFDKPLIYKAAGAREHRNP